MPSLRKVHEDPISGIGGISLIDGLDGLAAGIAAKRIRESASSIIGT
jgi:hypothetical protein